MRHKVESNSSHVFVDQKLSLQISGVVVQHVEGTVLVSMVAILLAKILHY